MIRFPAAALALALLLPAVPAGAAERSFSVGSFDRLRVDGGFRVVLTTGRSPGATVAGDPRVIDTLDIRVEGTTLVVRAGAGGWGEQPVPQGGDAPVIRLSTGMIHSAALIGGGDVTIVGPVRGQRVDLALTGGGSLSAAGLDADQLSATAIGSGSMTLGGRAGRVRLATNGTVRMRAGGLVAGDLTLRADGNGELVAQARYTATISAAGLGSVTVYGRPACTVRGVPDGPVSCGKSPPPAPPAP